MRKFTDVVQDRFGNALANATVTVRTANVSPGTGALATVYSDDGITVITGSAVVTDSNGRYSFYAADGRYDLTVTGTGITTTVVADVGEGGEVLSAKNINSTRFADQFAGADAGAKIAAAIADLPSTGGIVDATGLVGAQTISTNPFASLPCSVTLRLGHATFTVTSGAWVIGNDGLSTPSQKLLHIIGQGIDAGAVPAGKTPVSGTILDMQQSGALIAKIDSRGVGVLEIEGCTFRDTSGASLPFLQTTNTIVKIHDNQFFGSKSGTSCDQDCIVLGGTSTVTDGNSTAPFQGYGSFVKRNFFNHIRRAVYGRTYCNAVQVTGNTIWEQAGSNLAGGAAIEFVDSSGVNSNAGNTVSDNLIEVINYVYGVKFSANGVNNTLVGNNFYDGNLGASFVAGYRFETGSSYNYIVQGFQPDSFPCVSEDAGTAGKNTILTSHQSQTSLFPNLNKFTAGGGVQMTSASVNSPMYNSKITTTNDEFWWGINTAGQPTLGLWMYPAGGAAETLVSFRRYDANQRGIFINATTNGFVEATADLRCRAASGSNLWLGTNATPDVILIGNSLLKFNQHAVFKTDNTFDIGAAGATRPRNLYLAGKVSEYNSVATVNNGVPSIVASIDLGSLTADISNTGIYVAPVTGLYRVSFIINVNRAATTSSTMPSLTIFYSCGDGGGLPTFSTATNAANTLATADSKVIYANVTGGTAITYFTSGYASTGATSMQYTIHIAVEKL